MTMHTTSCSAKSRRIRKRAIRLPEPAACGLRKIRMASGGKGRRGGARVIYFYFASESRIGMLLAYAKNVKDDLTESEKKILAKIIKTWRQPS